MKLKFTGNNFDLQLTNKAGEPIYTYQAESIDVELDIVKLIDSIEEIQQAVIETIEKAIAAQ